MKWLYRLLGFIEEKVTEADDIGNITIRATDEPEFMKGDTIWFKEGVTQLDILRKR